MTIGAVDPTTGPAAGREPRWPAVLAILAVGMLYYALPTGIRVGPPWLLLVALVVLLVPTIVARRVGNYALNQRLAYVVLVVVTLGLVLSLVRLVGLLPARVESASDLLRSAGALWGTNVLVFASWYWHLDAGGPNARDERRARRTRHVRGAFLFPQMTLPNDLLAKRGDEHWHPEFVDYLFLAFNTSTAFSPTDAPVLSRWAKAAMMLQATLSLATLALLGARAINIL